MSIFSRFRQLSKNYSKQFWLLFWGSLISASGTSMIWPFMTIYVSHKLDIPLTQVSILITLSAIMSLVSSFIAGPYADKFGRKIIMAVSLAISALVYVMMGYAQIMSHFVILLIIQGLFSPLYRIGSDAMVADLVPDEKRADAYAILRMIHNVGVAVGPAVGGIFAATSYQISFNVAAVCLLVYAFLTIFFIKETLPQSNEEDKTSHSKFGFGTVFKDRTFMLMCISLVFITMGASQMFALLAIYAKTNFGLAENQSGLVMTANAIIVISFQYITTQKTKRRPPLTMLILGSALYMVGVGSVSFAVNLTGFILSMIVLSIGEMVLWPTATTLIAKLAPENMRGRYMGLFNLSQGFGFGIGPIFGSILNDNIGPVTIWYGGAILCAVSLILFSVQNRQLSAKHMKETSGV
jgi:MFS family permease